MIFGRAGRFLNDDQPPISFFAFIFVHDAAFQSKPLFYV